MDFKGLAYLLIVLFGASGVIMMVLGAINWIGSYYPALRYVPPHKDTVALRITMPTVIGLHGVPQDIVDKFKRSDRQGKVGVVLIALGAAAYLLWRVL